MSFRRRSASESRLSESRFYRNGGLSLPLVKRTDDLGPLPRSFSILNLLPTDRYSIPAQKLSRPIRDGYVKSSSYWSYANDSGWLDMHAKDRTVVGSRFWPTYSKYRRNYDAGRPSYVYPSWQPRYGARDFSDTGTNYWTRTSRDKSYYQSYRSWVKSSFTNDDFLTPNFTYSLKMPFFFYQHHKPRSPYMYYF
uniref:Uncharacterized protein n=1 Tax=Romanomermis culicivorax TaxID=13658 RepID=A0A915JQX7_ROMCU